MIDHIGWGYSDFARAKDFFTHCLAPLGATLIMEAPPESKSSSWAAGFGRDGKPSFWIARDGKSETTMEICFLAHSRSAVRGFHAAALANGATDIGPPGVRELFHPNYYVAFVRDFDGHSIAAVCHTPSD